MKYTFISVPALGDKQNTYLNIKGKLTEFAQVYKLNIPDFKVGIFVFSLLQSRYLTKFQIGTLDALVVLSDDLVKYDTVFEQSVNKLADMLNNLLRGQQANLQDQLLVNDSKYIYFVLYVKTR